MELTASGVRFLLSPAALDALVSLLALPPFREAKELTPADKEAGIAWLKENGSALLARMPQGNDPE